MNTSHTVALPPARADELARLLHWLTAGDRTALADLEDHLCWHATNHGGTFDHDGYQTGEDSILDTYATLIAAHVADLDRPDHDGDDR